MHVEDKTVGIIIGQQNGNEVAYSQLWSEQTPSCYYVICWYEGELWSRTPGRILVYIIGPISDSMIDLYIHTLKVYTNGRVLRHV